MPTGESLLFRVKPRILTLLGDQLIRDANVAVFELVKNAYDADASRCSVTLAHPNNESMAELEIRDDGCGMDESIIRDVWMIIATDFRSTQRKANIRTPRFNRFPLGEKGLGRLSVHKLGRFIRLVTRVKHGNELVVEFDWDRLESSDDLHDAAVTLRQRAPQTFPGNKHGTMLEVRNLRQAWTRGEFRRLYRAVNSLCSPYRGPADFTVTLEAPGCEDWLTGLLAAEAARQCAQYHVVGWFEGARTSFRYEFTPPPGTRGRLSSREVSAVNARLEGKDARSGELLDLGQFRIGKVEFEFWLFDRDPAVTRAVTDDIRGLKSYLDENGGIRIYRDGIRVYDFGEAGNDWLNLDLRRVNTPTARTSNNQILGVLRLDATKSGDLQEKSNREGFIETDAYHDFRVAVRSVLTSVEAEKSKDQKKLREALGKGTSNKFSIRIEEVREILNRSGVLPTVDSKLKEVEKEMDRYRDQLLHAAVPGLSIGIMLHGAEKILEELRVAAKQGAEPARIRELVDRLYRVMRPITNLLKNPGVTKTTATVLIQEARFSTELRLQRHGIQLNDGTKSGCLDFSIRGSKQMLVASLTNLIDNSIHWLEVRSPSTKRLYASTTNELDGGPAIVVADNGPGFGDDNPEDLIEPFFSRRNGGMGLGLYVVSEVMRVTGGRLVFPSHGDIDLPHVYDGAVVAMQFPRES